MVPGDQLPVLYSEISLDQKHSYAAHSLDYEEVVIQLPISVSLDSAKNRRVEDDPRAFFDSTLTSKGTWIQFDDAVFDHVSCRLLNNSRTVVLTPTLLNNNLQVKLNKIILELPDYASKNCVSSYKTTASSFILDILTAQGLFITLSFGVEDFTTSIRLTAQNFDKWGRIDMPYSIETRKPHYIKTLSEGLVIIPFVDGGLLHLKRASKFAQIETILFTDSSYFDSLTRFFKKKHEDELIDNNISTRTIITSALLNDDYLMTISINRKLKIWSLQSHSIFYEQDLFGDIASMAFFDVAPAELIKLVDSPSPNEFRLVIAIPFKNQLKLIVWNLAISSSEVLLQEVKRLAAPNIDELSWTIQSFEAHKLDDKLLKLLVLHRSNTLQRMLICDLDLQTTEFKWYNSKAISQIETPDSIPNVHFVETANEHYLSKLGNEYNDIVLSTVLGIFETHYNHQTSKKDLLDRILEIVNHDLDPESLAYLKDLKNQWLKFDGSCKELAKRSNEPIEFAYDVNRDLIYILKSHGESIYKRVSSIELLTYSHQSTNTEELDVELFGLDNVSAASLSQLVRLAVDFKNIFNDDVLDELKVYLLQLASPESVDLKMSQLFDEILSPGLTDDLISQLLQRLGAIPEVLKAMGAISDNLGEIKKFVSSRLSNLGTNFLLASLGTVIKLYEDFTLGLAMIMLVIDNNDQVCIFFYKLVTNLRRLQSVQKVLSLPKETLFTDIIFKRFDVEGFKLSNSDSLNNVLASVLNFMLVSDSFLLNAAVSLVSAGKAEAVLRSGLVDFLDNSSPVHIFLQGLTLLGAGQDDRALKLFISNSEKIISYELSAEERRDLSAIEDLSQVFGSGSLLEYYIKLTGLFTDKNQIKNAYSLAKMALKNMDSSYNGGEESDTVHWSLFQLSLKLSDYDRSFASIQALSSGLRLKSIKIFVLHLLDTKSTAKLLDYKFRANDFSVVDKILVDLAKEQDFISNSLYYHKILYTWRLKTGDKRAAAEALYDFIQKFNSSSLQSSKAVGDAQNLQTELRALYIIILNVVKTIRDAQDQWIMKVVENGANRVVTYDDLHKEFKTRF